MTNAAADQGNGEEKPSANSLFLKQCFAAAGPLVFSIGSGMDSGYMTTFLLALHADPRELAISDEKCSFILIIAAACKAAGCIVGGAMMGKLGRRQTCFIVCLPMILGWHLTTSDKDLKMMIMGRVLTWVSIGAFTPVSFVYIGEIASPDNAALLQGATGFASSIGIVMSHVLLSVLNWKKAAIAFTLPPLLALVLLFMAPESPVWLASQEDFSEAEKIFRNLQGSDIDAIAELQKKAADTENLSEENEDSEEAETDEKPSESEIASELEGVITEEINAIEIIEVQDASEIQIKADISAVESENPEITPITLDDTDAVNEIQDFIKNQLTELKNVLSSIKNITQPSFTKPFIFINIFFIIQQFSGNGVMYYYNVAMLNKYLIWVDKDNRVTILDMTQSVLSIISCKIMNKIGRPILATFSTLGAGMSFLILGGLLRREINNVEDNLIVLIFLFSSMFFVNLGLAPLPAIMAGEIFPESMSDFGVSSSSFFSSIFLIMVVKTGPFLFSKIEFEGIILLFGLIASFGSMFLYFSCPETINKKPKDIEKFFNS